MCFCSGQFECGAKKCMERDGLRSWEVNFAYVEHGEKKNALVKLRKFVLCCFISQIFYQIEIFRFKWS